jgi:hypothetical protein
MSLACNCACIQVYYPTTSGDVTTLPAKGSDLVNNGLTYALGNTTITNIYSTYGVNLGSAHSLSFSFSSVSVCNHLSVLAAIAGVSV